MPRKPTAVASATETRRGGMSTASPRRCRDRRAPPTARFVAADRYPDTMGSGRWIRSRSASSRQTSSVVGPTSSPVRWSLNSDLSKCAERSPNVDRRGEPVITGRCGRLYGLRSGGRGQTHWPMRRARAPGPGRRRRCERSSSARNPVDAACPRHRRTGSCRNHGWPRPSATTHRWRPRRRSACRRR